MRKKRKKEMRAMPKIWKTEKAYIYIYIDMKERRKKKDKERNGSDT